MERYGERAERRKGGKAEEAKGAEGAEEAEEAKEAMPTHVSSGLLTVLLSHGLTILRIRPFYQTNKPINPSTYQS